METDDTIKNKYLKLKEIEESKSIHDKMNEMLTEIPVDKIYEIYLNKSDKDELVHAICMAEDALYEVATKFTEKKPFYYFEVMSRFAKSFETIHMFSFILSNQK